MSDTPNWEAIIAAHVSVFTPPPASALSAFKGSFRGELGINADAAPTRNHGVGFRKSGRRSRSGRRRAVRSLRAGWTAISARRTWLGARKVSGPQMFRNHAKSGRHFKGHFPK